MKKKIKMFRFPPELYARFKEVARDSGYTVTNALEFFMDACCKQDRVVFPEPVEKPDVDHEARVLLGYLNQKEYWYRACGGGEELSVRGRLFQLLPQIKDKKLAIGVEEALTQEKAHDWVHKLNDEQLIEALKNIG